MPIWSQEAFRWLHPGLFERARGHHQGTQNTEIPVMRLNERICIVGQRVVLMPYKEEYVPKYHEWMKSEELQELTASEPLTLEEEYAMQKTWRNDEDKLTFIVLDRQKLEADQVEEAAMVGDTNIFLRRDDDAGRLVGEIEIMIADGGDRGKGFGLEATMIMMKYGVSALDIGTYEAKIGMTNAKSIRLFQDKLGFRETSRSEVFQEITFSRDCADESFAEMLKKYFDASGLDIREIEE